MKKIFLIILALAFVSIVPIVSAADNNIQNILLKSNTSYGIGNVFMWNDNQVQVLGVNFPKSEYTLVYLVSGKVPEICDRRTPGCQIRPGPSKYSSSRYPRAICIVGGIRTTKEGYLNKTGNFSYTSLSEDNKDGNLALVKHSDVNCKTGTMKKWKTDQYWFGTEAI